MRGVTIDKETRFEAKGAQRGGPFLRVIDTSAQSVRIGIEIDANAESAACAPGSGNVNRLWLGSRHAKQRCFVEDVHALTGRRHELRDRRSVRKRTRAQKVGMPADPVIGEPLNPQPEVV